MTDIFSTEQRKSLMRRVKNKNTNIELILRKKLFNKGFRYKVKNTLFGKPDIIFPKQKLAIFCDGDFWHGKNYEKEKKNYNKFWREKIHVNIERDKKVNRVLKQEGWKVLRFWKTDILKDSNGCIKKIELCLISSYKLA